MPALLCCRLCLRLAVDMPVRLSYYSSAAREGGEPRAHFLPGVMLAARHAAERLQNCWHGGARSTGQLRDAMSAALAEYVTSGDSAEAARCLAELDVPHFHHELVKCAVLLHLPMLWPS